MADIFLFEARAKAVDIPVPPVNRPVEEPPVDQVTVAQLEQALELARRGQLTGLVLMGWDETVNGFLRWVSLPVRESDGSIAAFRFLGAQCLIKNDLEFMATQNYKSLADDVAAIESGE